MLFPSYKMEERCLSSAFSGGVLHGGGHGGCLLYGLDRAAVFCPLWAIMLLLFSLPTKLLYETTVVINYLLIIDVKYNFEYLPINKNLPSCL